jgi:ELWxxDGT repeat protein
MMKWQETASQASRGILPLSGMRKRRPLTNQSGHRRRQRTVEIETLEVRTLLSSTTAQLINDVNAVPSFPSDLTPAGSNLFYLVEDSTDSGNNLEVTNASGTQVLMDFPSSSSGASGTPSDLTAIGNDVFFTTSTSSSATLWTSNGTVSGTVQVSVPNTSVESFEFVSALGNTLVFATQSDQTSTDDQLWAIAAGSSTPTMLADLGDSYPSVIGAVGSTLYLDVEGNLWTTDGTAANTQEVMDNGEPITAPTNVFGFDNQTFAFANNSDQTTISVLGSSSLTPVVTLSTTASSPVVVGSRFYFTAGGSGGNSASQLWVSNGTATGTEMVEDFSAISDNADPTNLIDADNTLFFTITGSNGLSELWTSNGTAQGTALVKDLGIAPGFDAYAANLASAGDNLFFTADDGTQGAELWVDNVGTGTTQLVDDINPGAAGSDPTDFAEFNNLLYFAANDGATPTTNQLWSSGGTAASTTMVASFSPGVTDGASVFSGESSDDIDTGSDILLPLTDGVHGTALWSTDGTAAGTITLAAVDPSAFASVNGTVYFLATSPSSKLGLWSTNGTAAGTTEVKDLSSFGTSSYYYGSSNELATTGSKLFFTTGDGNGGTDLWTSNGTASGTSIVKDFAVPSGVSSYDVSVSSLKAFGNDLIFIADDGTHGSQVWITDGTQAGTQMLTDVNATPSAGSTYVVGADPSSLTVAGNQVYFEADSPNTTTTADGLWVTNGTPGGTTEITTIPAITVPDETTTSPGTLSNLTAVGSTLFFSVSYDYYNGQTDVRAAQLWTSNGTAAGTGPITLTAGSPTFTQLSNFNAVGDRLLFEAVESDGSTDLWASDGTSAGTTFLKVINPTSSSTNYNYYYNYGYSGNGASLVANGVLYFAANDGSHGTQLWESDGTAAGTYLADEINPGSAGSDPIPLGVLNGQVILLANDGVHGSELMTLVSSSQTAAPGLVSIPAQDVTVGETLQLNVSSYAFDPNTPGLPLTYSLTGTVPTGASIDPTTGLLTWATTADQSIGATSITVMVADNSSPALTASQTITVNVDALEPPSIATIPTQDVGVGHTFQLNVSNYATDPNDPPYTLTYSLTSAPTGATIDPTTGVITWPTASNQATTSYSFSVTVTDDSPQALTASETFSVQVNSVYPPEIETIPIQGINIGQTLTVKLSTYVYDFSDPTLPLTYTLGANAPAGTSIDATTGVLTWTPESSQATGTISIPFTASDNSTPANTSSGTVTVELGAPGAVRPPALAPFSTQRVLIGQTFNFDISQYASDPNTPPLALTYSLGSGAPTGATIDATTGEITWETAPTQAVGAYTIPVIVTDDGTPAQSTTESLTVNVVASNTILGPKLAPLPTEDAVIGSTLQVNISDYASDPNVPAYLPLTYSLGSSPPAGASIDPTTGVLTYTPPANQSTGFTFITVYVTDSYSSTNMSSAELSVDVFAAGSILPPLVQSISTQTVTAGQELQLNVSQYASEPNSQTFVPFTYTLVSNPPSGASIDSTTGAFNWTPSADQTGTTFIEVQVADSESPPQTTTVGFEVEVFQYSPPVIQTIPSQSATSGKSYSLNVSQYVSDPNTGALPLTYSLGFTAPSGMTISPSTGVVSWTPSSYQLGSNSVTVTVTDSQSPSASTSETFTVDVAGQPATFETVPAQSATIGQELSVYLGEYASDPNSPPESLTYTLGSGAPSGASISSSGEFTWTPGASQPVGTVPITVTVADEEDPSQTVSQTFDVNVAAAPIVPPAITAIPSSVATLGKTFTLDLSQYASDPNVTPLPLTYTLGAGAPSGASIDSGTEEFTWTPASSQAPGTYAFTVAVSDNESPPMTTLAGFTVVLSSTPINPPTLQTIPAQSATIGTPFSLNVSQYASDPNTPPLPLTYSLTGTIPSGASINPESGLLTWTPAANTPTGATSITVVVSDNESPPQTAQRTITVNVVSNVVNPPGLKPIPTQSATIGKPFSLNVSQYASDPNTPPLPLTYSLTGTVPSGASINPESGVLTWTPAANQHTGATSITVVVSDNESPPQTAQETITVDVFSTVVNPPVLHAIPTQSATIGSPFSLNVSQYASDPNTPPLPLTYSLGVGAPAGASINPSSGLFTWTPQAGQPTGLTSITIIVADNNSPPLTATGTLTINVAAQVVKVPPTPVAPVLATIPTQTADVGQSFQLNVSSFASDPNTPPLPLTYSLGLGAPSGATINPSTGLLAWSLGANQTIGTYPITVEVADNESPPRTTSETFNVTVADTGPALTILSPKVSTKKGFTITLTFSEPVNPSTAANPNNYILTAPAKKPKGRHKPTPPPTRIGLSVTYNPSTNQVVLKATKKPKTSPALTLTVVGSGPSGIAKLDGLQLAGSGGQAGTNYVASVTGKAVHPTAAVTGNRIVVRTAVRSAHSAVAVKPRPVRPGSEAGHPVKIGSIRPTGPMAMVPTPVVGNVVLGVIPTDLNPPSRIRRG